MKKLLVLAPMVAVLAACSTGPLAKLGPAQVQAIQANSKTYKCDNSTEVVSIYSERGGENYANVKVTSPTLGLNQAALVLKQAVSASGARYMVTTPDKATTYVWHTKNNEGNLSVTNQGNEYMFRCNAI